MNPTLRDQLKQWERQHKRIIKNSCRQTKKRKSEQLSEEDIKSLMGINKPTYRRGKGGAWRNRH